MGYNGVTDDTYRRFLIDAGAVHVGFTSIASPGTLLGATRGGNTFTIEAEMKDMPVDGAKGRVKGHQRLTKVNASMTVNLVEITRANLLLALPGASAANFPSVTPTHDEITRALQVALTDYKTNIALIGEVAGLSTPMVFIIENVLAAGGIEIGATDNEEAVLKITLNAHFDPEALDEEPWRILRPLEPVV